MSLRILKSYINGLSESIDGVNGVKITDGQPKDSKNILKYWLVNLWQQVATFCLKFGILLFYILLFFEKLKHV